MTQLQGYNRQSASVLGAPTVKLNVSSPKAHPRIVFVVTSGFAARMMLRTGITTRLKAAGADISVISPNAHEEYFKQECEDDGVKAIQSVKLSSRVAGWFRSHRVYFVDDVLGNPAMRSLHRYRFKNRPLSALQFELINRTVGRSRPFRTMFKAFERQFNRSAKIGALLRELRPDLLVVPNPFGTEETVYFLHAKDAGIPVACPILSWDNITTKGTPLLMPDHFISWGPVMTAEIVDVYGFAKEKIYECGVPHFDIYARRSQLVPRGKLMAQLKLPPDRPYIFYGTTVEMYCPKELEIIAWLVEQVNRDAFSKPCSLVIRPHPQMISGLYASDSKALDTLKSMVGPRVALNIPRIMSERLGWDLPKDDMRFLASLLTESAMCLNANSTLCLDGCMAGRPVINIGFDGAHQLPYEDSARQCLDFIHMAKLLAFGGARLAKSFFDLKTLIDLYLQNPERDHEGRKLSVQQECGPSDGQSAARVAEVLSQLARRESADSIAAILD